MSLRVYNTLTGQKEPFEPIVPGKVGMYVCGVTVYDYCHIGHARANIVFDIIYRYLKFLNFDVTYVRNYTDVDDKIINRANERGISSKQLSEEFIQAFDEDMSMLGLEKPSIEPKATEHISEIIDLIEKLIAKGCAYPVEGDVYFAVESFPTYLKLSKRNLEDMLAGARIATGDIKRHPMDFALWKNAKPDEPSWESPWGLGRPGWHIECSAMGMRYLGESFDIHGGGKDLIFPHHENEIAQSEASSDKPFVKYWLHNGFVNIDQEKMSKSLGNFFTIRDILKKYDPEVLRFFILQAHYRSPIDFSDKNLLDARTGLSRIYEAFSQIETLPEPKKDPPMPETAAALISSLASTPDRFADAMNDDFNSALSIAVLFDAVRDLNSLVDLFKKKASKSLYAAINDSRSLLTPILKVLGICLSAPTDWLERQKDSVLEDMGLTRSEIETMIQARTEARTNKDFAMSDKIRDDLAQQNILILDTPEGTVWRIKYI